MKKVVAFLEDYAQWLALGVAILFLGYVAWTYVISPDVLKTQVGQANLLPGEVDSEIKSRQASTLDAAMKRGGGDALAKLNNVPPYVDRFVGDMKPKAVANSGPISPPVPESRPIDDGPKDPVNQALAALPVVPKPIPNATPLAINTMIADPALKKVQIVQMLQAGQGNAPLQPVQPAVGVNGQPVAVGVDMPIITYEFKMLAAGLASAWKDAFPNALNVPPTAMETHFLKVEVVREEMTGRDVHGKEIWGNETPVQRLDLYPRNLFELPATGLKQNKTPADKNAEAQFLIDILRLQTEVVEPIFYDVLAAHPDDQWGVPSLIEQKRKAEKEAGAATVADTVFDPANPPPPERMTDQQKQAVYIYNQQKKAEEQKQKAAANRSKATDAEKSRGSRGSRGGSSGGRGYAPRDGDRLGGEEFGRGGRPNYQGVRPESRDGGIARPQFDPNMPTTLQGGVPTGPFNPLLLVPQGAGAVVVPNPNQPTNDIILWGHDDTVVPGKTYRYKMKVYLKNPFYDTQGVAKNQADTTKLWIMSDWSEPTAGVTVPLTTIYYFTKANQIIANNTISSVDVEVLKKSKGKWWSETFKVSPGDGVGTVKGENDFSTGKFVVDLRSENAGRQKDTRIILCDEAGNLEPLMIGNQASAVLYDEIKKKMQNEAGVGENGAAPVPVVPVGTGGGRDFPRVRD